MKIHIGDNVLVRTGKYRNKSGKVLRIYPKTNQIVVEKVNIRTRHIKKQAGRRGERIQYEAAFDASNVMVLAPEAKEPSRIGYVKLENGKKQRILKKFPKEHLVADRDTKRTKKR